MQATVDAAAAVPNAVAYLPTGQYEINETIVLPAAAAHYWVEGMRMHSVLLWVGPPGGGPIVRVEPGAAVTIKNLAIQPSNISSAVTRVLVRGSVGGRSRRGPHCHSSAFNFCLSGEYR